MIIYSPVLTTRLQYVCDFIFSRQLGLDITYTQQISALEENGKPAINYSNTVFANQNILHLQPQGLLSETGISEKKMECFVFNNHKAFFKTGGDYPFDIFAAVFYLISRYEEYLPHEKDMYGRYAHENALAFKEGFLHLPLVNIWLQHFGDFLLQKFPGLEIKRPVFSYTPTYDIDIAYAWKNKGFLRDVGGTIKDASAKRLLTLIGGEQDPFDKYDELDELHAAQNIHPIYFFLVADRRSKYDKNNHPETEAMQRLFRLHAAKYVVGLHPSWRSYEEPGLIAEEKAVLEKAISLPIQKSRQHYIRLTLPITFRHLIHAGIQEDYSMGYGSINGFRSSVASSHFWFDLEKNEATPLVLYPYCYMDANCFFEQKLTVDEAAEELNKYYNICKAYNGHFITIFHNNILGRMEMFKGWWEMYGRFISGVFAAGKS